MSAVVARYNEAGSLYPDIYWPVDPLNANSLLYVISGYLGRVIGPGLAFRLSVGSYLLLTPLATLYLLRAFARPGWGAIAAVPLAYNESWVYGFANFVFGAPLMLVGFAVFVDLTRRPSRARGIVAASLLAVTFLAHVQLYLWLVGLCFGATVVGGVAATWHRTQRTPADVVKWAALAVAPSALLAARWAHRAFSPPPPDELVTFGTANTSLRTILDARRPFGELLGDVGRFTDVLKGSDSDSRILVTLLLLGAVSFVLASRHRSSSSGGPWLELACLAAVASYFLLPEHIPAQSVIGSRHIGIALWFAPVFFTPVPARVSRWLHGATIVTLVILSLQWLVVWRGELAKFHATEGRGLDAVLAAVPEGKRLYYVNHLDAESRFFPFHALWHVDKWSMADKGAQCPDNPAYGQMNPLRYRARYPLHRAILTASWEDNPEIHDNFDVVMVARWRPSEGELATAAQRYELLAHEGDFWLWRRR
jgi:hypothetical protein